MQVSVETTQGLQRRMTVQVPSERVDKEVENRLRSLRGTVRLDGFRPGKVPLTVVQKRFGGQVRGEVLNEILQSTYAEAVGQENLRPAGPPEIDATQIDAGKDIEYVATFEVMPEVAVQGIESIEVERPQVELTDADIDRVLDNVRKQRATYSAVDRAADTDDRVMVDFTGDIDGESFAGNEGTDVPVTIGSNQMPPEFEESLKGVKAGEKKDIEYTFPEQFPDEQVRGKTAVFHVEVKSVEAPELPEVNDELAAQLGVTEGGVEALRARIRENLERERDQAVQARIKPQVMDGLAKANEIELPKVLVDSEIDHLRKQAQERMQQQMGQQGDALELPGELFETEARKRVTLGLLVNEIVRENELKVDRERVQAMLQNIASQYEQPQEVIRYYTQNRQLMENLEISVMEDQVVDWVLERAKVKDQSMSFEELMQPSAPEPEADNAE